MLNSNSIIYNKICPICGYSIQSHFLDLGNLVDSTHVVETQDIALNLPKLPHHFCYCPQCEAIWNDCIDHSKTSFNKRLYKMYNQGKNWGELNSKSSQIIINAVKNLINIKPNNSTITIIDIGCADGYFINLIAEHILNNPNEYNVKNHKFKFLGFDLNPNDTNTQNSYFEYHQQYFNPAQDIQKYQPDILIFKQMICYLDIKFWDNLILNVAIYKQQNNYNFPIYSFISEENFDDVFDARHYNEFYYSSYVNFPNLTFEFLIHKLGKVITFEKEPQTTHNSIAFIEISSQNETNSIPLNSTAKTIANLHKANTFYQQSFSEINTIKQQLQNLHSNKKDNQQIIIWGSGARGNQFINLFALDNQKFPLIVDSDSAKTGYYIPGTGQQIIHYKQINKTYENIIIITTQWKVNDIYHTIKQQQINYNGGIYIVKNGNLLNYE